MATRWRFGFANRRGQAMQVRRQWLFHRRGQAMQVRRLWRFYRRGLVGGRVRELRGMRKSDKMKIFLGRFCKN
jgi:hypothetical protein